MLSAFRTFRSSHSRNTKHFHLMPRSRRSGLWSRSRFRLIFSGRYSKRDLGIRPSLQAWPCQKQPCMNTNFPSRCRRRCAQSRGVSSRVGHLPLGVRRYQVLPNVFQLELDSGKASEEPKSSRKMTSASRPHSGTALLIPTEIESPAYY
jgi:hypothetical protein